MPSQQLNKIGVEWGGSPESFSCQLTRSEEPDPDNPGNLIIVWRLATGYEVLTQEGERLQQDETWVLPAAAVTVTEGIRTRVANRVRQRNGL